MDKKKRVFNPKSDNFAAYNEDAKLNKNAFTDVIGDPFAIDLATKEPNPIMGNYMRLQRRGSIQAIKNDFDMGKGTRNPAQPNVQDFLCDVDRIVGLHFKDDREGLTKFQETYILESEDGHYTPRERMLLEQKIGKLFRRHKLSPVSKYFTTIRGLTRQPERKPHGSSTGANSRG